ncbi:flagellar hook assembly protein FlgD [Lederbergia wuyishanensis]|uniref:Basal-body rod modification protein FlgD n=1 Tax=Lederbergia wuyishanensis TaxID=1347903 RepID=A0ABU0CZS2_9BACI|nr:flagellar hook assembly protein FlgD [Lederbergia wuyishanensis]MCJ8006268.1 flagellar hook assembly protein FlgD [Lederbergia wuyishanensis]MDQ0341637.1 flagellar basal-body rod modification protein FlgD [Lederbergia wuyishanensis]
MSISINSDLLYSSVQKREVKTGKDILGKDDFLKLLMVQLQNQDPMNPMQDKEFIAQMATFSSLEQMTNMNKSIESLVQFQSQSSLISLSQFVGKEVTWHKVNEETSTSEPTFINGKGIVSSVQFVGDTVKFTLEDGTELAPANISEVNNISAESPLISATSMIGKNISWMEDEEELSGIVKSVSMKNNIVFLHTEEGQAIKNNDVIKIS